jgi:hypothetical protein
MKHPCCRGGSGGSDDGVGIDQGRAERLILDPTPFPWLRANTPSIGAPSGSAPSLYTRLVSPAARYGGAVTTLDNNDDDKSAATTPPPPEDILWDIPGFQWSGVP